MQCSKHNIKLERTFGNTNRSEICRHAETKYAETKYAETKYADMKLHAEAKWYAEIQWYVEGTSK